MRLAGVGQPEDQQRPVPQVQRVGHRAQRHQRGRGEQPAGPGQPVAGGRVGLAVGGGQDHQDRGADGDQRPRPGELPDSVDERPARDDRGQSERGQRGAQPHRPGDVGHQRADQSAQQQLPGAGEAVVVRGGLVGLMSEHGKDERRDRQRGQQTHEGGAQPLAERTAQRVGKQKDKNKEGDVELSLNRHRPDVLQRTDRLTGAQVVRRRRRQLPVLVVTEAGQALVSKCLPAGLRLHQDGQHRGGGKHDHECREKPAHQPDDLRPRGKRRLRLQCRAQQRTAEEEARQHQEHVDATGDPSEPHMEDRNERDRDAAKAVEIVAVEPGFPRSHSGGRSRTHRSRCRRSGRGEGQHDRSTIYRTRAVGSPAANPPRPLAPPVSKGASPD